MQYPKVGGSPNKSLRMLRLELSYVLKNLILQISADSATATHRSHIY